MSVPFSNTTLRIPRGFGTLLEGLSREVLRDQPRDIIEFAAEYFENLLKIRTDSGIDPAEWAAQLEDRFYNNYAFKKKQTPKPEKEPKSAPVAVDTAHKEKGEGILGQAHGVKGLRKICIKKPDEQTSVMQQDEEWLSKQPRASELTDKTTSGLIEPQEDQLEEKSQVLTGAAPEEGPLDDTVSKAPVEAMMEDTTSQVTGAGTEEGLLEGADTQMTGGTPTASSLAMTDTQEISATSEQGQLEGTASGVIAATPEKIHHHSSMMLAPSETVSGEDTAPQMITTASADGQEENIQSIEELPMDEEWLSKQPGASELTDKTTSGLIEPQEDQLEEKSQVLTGAAPEEGPLDDTVSKAPVEAMMEDTTSQVTGAGTEEGLLEGADTQMTGGTPTASSLAMTDTQEISATSEQGQLEGTASGVIEATPEAALFKKSASSMLLATSEIVSGEDTASQIIITVSADDQEEKIQSTDELPRNTSKNEDHAAAVIQSVYRGYSTRKKLKENASSQPETDDDLFTEACPRPNGIRNSSGEELAFSEGENINFEKALAMTGEKTKSRMGVDGLHTTAKDGTAEISICAAELGSPLVKENINTDADICGAELQSVMKEDNKAEMDGYNICGTELDQKDFSEAPSSSTVNVDICSTELGFVVGKEAGQEESKSNETDIKPQGEPAVKVTEEAPHQQEVSGVPNDRED